MSTLDIILFYFYHSLYFYLLDFVNQIKTPKENEMNEFINIFITSRTNFMICGII